MPDRFVYVRVALDLLAAGIALSFPALQAQRATDHPAHWCFRGSPAPVCDVFWLTEFGAAFRVADNRHLTGPLYTWELGLMSNHGANRAFGAAAFAQAGNDVFAFGVRPRARLWLSGSTSVDLAPGLVLAGTSPGPGFSGLAAINFGDVAAVTTNLMVLRPRPFETGQGARVSLFIGGRVGSALGTTAMAGTGALILAFVIGCGSGQCFD
jgi:hypothetical protein